ncbi:ABC transporter permease [Colwellia sp. E2M01]|uniref:ABC transporter permease n=1 Tax=Colwellia sp. E2M01 TaxID=2841561 RepID=UPI001C08335C|nr:ABC transporter permease [Colwellia sp. E2M01]MBU2871595.1 ABC transporter permease [Colwellia sp. E2M01]
MFNNYLLIAFRNIFANKLFSAINILGLAIGLTVCFLILIFVQYESTYEQHLKEVDRTYRITRHYTNDDINIAGIAAPFKPLIQAQFNEIEAITLMGMTFNLQLGRNDIFMDVTDMLWADNDIFDVFNFTFIYGDRASALTRKNTLVLTESMAKHFFGNENPVGKYLFLNAQQRNGLEITAVIKDQPDNTHLTFSLLMSIETMRNWLPEDLSNWHLNYYYIYIKLKQGVSPEILTQRLSSMMDSLGNQVTDDQKLKLQPVADIHLHSNLSYEIKANGRYATVYSFSVIAIIILLLACINFMNLSTARSSQRGKEVAVRKVLGATGTQLAIQFLIESILMTAFAMFIACTLVELCLPWFSFFIERDLVIESLYNWQTALGVMLATIIVGCFAGSYPAFYISNFNPSRLLHGQPSKKQGPIYLRKLLLILQFSISISLILATFVVLKQIDFARSTNPGYEIHNKVALSLYPIEEQRDYHKLYRQFKNKLLQHPDIKSVSAAKQLLTEPLRDIWAYVHEEEEFIAKNIINLPTLNTGLDFFNYYKIPLVAGRYFSLELGDSYVQIPTRSNSEGRGNAIISVSAAQALGYTPEEAINKYIKIIFSPGVTQYKIVGVVEDIHIGSLRDKKKPQVYHLVREGDYSVGIEFNPKNTHEAIKYIDKTFAELMPNRPNNRTFLSDNFNAMYNQEDKQAKVFLYFSVLALIIASMGLFGLVSYSTERRRKEIGIRKVMGATIFDLVWLISNEFLMLVLLANILAWPIAYFTMNNWLQGFTQSISLDIWLFMLAGILPLTFAGLIVIAQTFFNVVGKPINHFRSE